MGVKVPWPNAPKNENSPDAKVTPRILLTLISQVDSDPGSSSFLEDSVGGVHHNGFPLGFRPGTHMQAPNTLGYQSTPGFHLQEYHACKFWSRDNEGSSGGLG